MAVPVLRRYHSQHYGSLIRCFADGCNKRKIKLWTNTPRDLPEPDRWPRIYKPIRGSSPRLLVSEALVYTFHRRKVDVGGEGEREDEVKR